LSTKKSHIGRNSGRIEPLKKSCARELKGREGPETTEWWRYGGEVPAVTLKEVDSKQFWGKGNNLRQPSIKT